MPANIDISELEKMAKLRLSENEKDEISNFLEFLTCDLEKLSQIRTAEVKPLIHGIELTNIFREDKSAKWISRDKLLENAPEHEDGYFKVPKTID